MLSDALRFRAGKTPDFSQTPTIITSNSPTSDVYEAQKIPSSKAAPNRTSRVNLVAVISVAFIALVAVVLRSVFGRPLGSPLSPSDGPHLRRADPQRDASKNAYSLQALKARATLGSEFTFQPKSRGALFHKEKLAQAILAKCPDCQVEPGDDIFEVGVNISYPDDFWMQVSTDISVIETQMKPMPWNEYARRKERIEQDLFNTARGLDLRPDVAVRRAKCVPYRAGGGHIHLGLYSTFRDARHLLNFIIDQQNHPELATGILANNPQWAMPLAGQAEHRREAFAKVIAEVGPNIDRISLVQLAEILNRQVFYYSEFESYGDPKYQQVSLGHAETDNPTLRHGNPHDSLTVELRGVRPEANVEEFLAFSDFFLRRVAATAEMTGIAPYERPILPLTPATLETNEWFGCSVEIKQSMINRFYAYTTATGLGWDEFFALIDPNLRDELTTGALRDPRV